MVDGSKGQLKADCLRRSLTPSIKRIEEIVVHPGYFSELYTETYRQIKSFTKDISQAQSLVDLVELVDLRADPVSLAPLGKGSHAPIRDRKHHNPVRIATSENNGKFQQFAKFFPIRLDIFALILVVNSNQQSDQVERPLRVAGFDLGRAAAGAGARAFGQERAGERGRRGAVATVRAEPA